MSSRSTINQEDAELAILEKLYSSGNRPTQLKQRDLAGIAGASLGMTNAILKRLAQKGLIKIRRLNSRNVQYAVTPDGVAEIAKRSYRYLKRTIKNIVIYRERIDEAISAAKIRGLSKVKLIGKSDLDFIVEHACLRHGLNFSVIDSDGTLEKPGKKSKITAEDGCFMVFNESLLPPIEYPRHQMLYLASISI